MNLVAVGARHSAYPGNSYNACNYLRSALQVLFQPHVKFRLDLSDKSIFANDIYKYIKPKASSTEAMNVTNITMIIVGSTFNVYCNL